MSRKIISSVECQIPGDLSEFVSFDSQTSLLDSDIILFNPSITEYTFASDSYKGKPALTDDRSFQLKEAADHWRRELSEAYRAGKTVFVLLPELQEVYIDSGKREYSGTGQNRQTTRLVTEFTNYMCLPLELSIVASQGKNMKLTRAGSILTEYWREFEGGSNYNVLISGKIGEVTVVTRAGEKTTGSLLLNQDSGGALILLPYINLWAESFYEETGEQDEEDEDDDVEQGKVDFTWTKEGVAFGHKYLNIIFEIDRALRESASLTPSPDWVDDETFVLPKEHELNEKLLKVAADLEKLQNRKDRVKDDLVQESSPKRLLYEKGKPLENAVVDALMTIGFDATPHRDSESEFDVVFESSEGRLLGEVEGKDNKFINIDKLRQLEMNILEDFESDDVETMAKGVLFGNAFRLTRVEERGEFFTQKCKTAAKRGV